MDSLLILFGAFSFCSFNLNTIFSNEFGFPPLLLDILRNLMPLYLGNLFLYFDYLYYFFVLTMEINCLYYLCDLSLNHLLSYEHN